jgi:Cu+-exporting ATPase
MSIMVATGVGAHVGVLVKNADALEALGKVTTVVVDKTGTLTEGKPSVNEVAVASGVDRAELLALVGAAELRSEHPLARAIVEHAESEGAAFRSIPARIEAARGFGIRGEVAGRSLAFGTEKLLAEASVSMPAEAIARAEALRRQGQTVSFAAIGGRYAGLWALGDTVKPTSKGAMESLRSAGVRTLMLTGDARTSALLVARAVGLTPDDVVAEVLPQDKARIVTEQRARGDVVAMAGDGINDAPALAAAHVGIAMGSGTDIAIESAGVTLVKGDLRGIARAILLGRAARRNIRENLVLAFGYNVLALPLAAGVLYPAFGLTLSPMIAAAAMSASSVSVILNALRLRNALRASR